jgi:hypothetical protein
MVYLDRFFYNVAWDALFSSCMVQALSLRHTQTTALYYSPASAHRRRSRASGSRNSSCVRRASSTP